MARIAVLLVLFALLLCLILVLPLLFIGAEGPAPAGETAEPQKPSITLPNITLPIPKPSRPAPSELTPPPPYNLSAMEEGIHEKVNAERARYSLAPLEYNPDLAGVARDHSISLARENEPLTDPQIYCHEIFIHHEGFDFGLYEADRLLGRGIYYFELVGENIFMTSAWEYLEADADYAPCFGELEIVREYDSPALVMEDYQKHLDYAAEARRVNWTRAEWLGEDELEQVVVDGWMESPGHRANILQPDFGEEGIGVAKVNDFIIVTEVLIDRAECGYPGAACCEDNLGVYCYEPWDCRGRICR